MNLYDRVVSVERLITGRDENYPPGEVSDRRLKVLCKALEAGSMNTMGTAVSMYSVRMFLRDVSDNCNSWIDFENL